MALSKITTASLADDSVSTDQIANNAVISTSGAITTTGAFTSLGINDDADANVLTINSSEAVGIGKSLTPNNYSGYQVVTIGGSDASTGAVIDMENSSGLINGQLNASSGRLHIGVDPLDANGGSAIRFEVDGSSKFEMGSENLTINDGNLVIGTAGHGIDFSATPNSGGANQAEVLDDYEEGTWTPTLPSGGTIDVINAATYTKIGNVVRVGFYLQMSNIPNDSSAFYIGGLPFLVAYTGGGGNDHYHGAGSITYVGGHNINGFGMLPPTPWTNNDDFYFHRGDGNSSTVTNSNMTGCPYIICATSYITDA